MKNKSHRKSIAYIISQYPTLSMIFVIREVIQLKAMGFNIDTVSINAPDRNIEKMITDETNEAKSTYYIKPNGLKGAILAHIKLVWVNPKGYINGLFLALKLSQLNLKSLFYNLMYFSEALMVGIWMIQKKQVHLHAHLGNQAMTVALFVKAVFGYTFSATIHGPDEFYDVQGQFLPEKIAAADFIICISYFARSQLMKLASYEDWGKFYVCRLGVDPSLFSPRSYKKHLDIFNIICVGRLTPAKGQHILIDAISDLTCRGKSIRLSLVGDGVDRLSLERHVKTLGLETSVIFEGGVNQDRIRDLYAQADAFCIASFAEGIPVVLMEAMAMAIPCVTTRITGIPELIDDGHNGLLVTPSSVEELTYAIEKLMSNSKLRLAIGYKGREKIISDYNLEENVKLLADVFTERL